MSLGNGDRSQEVQLETATAAAPNCLAIPTTIMSSAEEDLASERLISAEENTGQLEAQTAESPPDSPPSVARVRDKLQQRLMT